MRNKISIPIFCSYDDEPILGMEIKSSIIFSLLPTILRLRWDDISLLNESTSLGVAVKWVNGISFSEGNLPENLGVSFMQISLDMGKIKDTGVSSPRNTSFLNVSYMFIRADQSVEASIVQNPLSSKIKEEPSGV